MVNSAAKCPVNNNGRKGEANLRQNLHRKEDFFLCGKLNLTDNSQPSQKKNVAFVIFTGSPYNVVGLFHYFHDKFVLYNKILPLTYYATTPFLH